MNCERIETMISGYVDQELTQQDAQLVRLHLEDCSACRRLHAELKDLKGRMAGLDWPHGDEAGLEALERDLFARVSAGIGWFLIVLGAALLLILGVVEFMSADSMPWYEKLGIALVWLAPVALLVSVIRQRLLTYRNDRYRNVKL